MSEVIKFKRFERKDDLLQHEEYVRHIKGIYNRLGEIHGTIKEQSASLNKSIQLSIGATTINKGGNAISYDDSALRALLTAHTSNYYNPHLTDFGDFDSINWHVIQGEVVDTGDGATTDYSYTLSVCDGSVAMIAKSWTVLKWTYGGEAQVVQDNGDGFFYWNGAAIGSLEYNTGTLDLSFTLAPDDGKDITVDFAYAMEDEVIAVDGTEICWKPSYRISGSGTATYIPVFTGAKSIGDSIVYQDCDTEYDEIDIVSSKAEAGIYVSTSAEIDNGNAYLTLSTSDSLFGLEANCAAMIASSAEGIPLASITTITAMPGVIFRASSIYFVDGQINAHLTRTGFDLSVPLRFNATSFYSTVSCTPTANRSVTLPDAGGRIVLEGGTPAIGDLLVADSATTFARVAVTVPAANILNVLGVVHGETTFSVKSIHDSSNPEAITAGASEAAGTSLYASHRDHVHASPATWAAAAHQLDSATYHTVSGLTPGHVLTALTATTFGFSAPAAAGVTGSGTAGTIAKFTAGTVLGDSLFTESGSTISILGNITLNATTTGQNRTLTVSGYDTVAAGVKTADLTINSTGRCLFDYNGSRWMLWDKLPNIFLGPGAGNLTLSGTDNIIIGTASPGSGITSGTGNIGIGYRVFASLTSGSSNTYISHDAYFVTGSSNCAFGYNAGRGGGAGGSGSYNNFFGQESGYAFTSGANNVGMGYRSCKVTTGSNNIAIGHQAGQLLGAAGSNVCIGASAGGSCYGTAAYNFFLGTGAGASVAQHSGGVYIGQNAGYSGDADYNIMIGYEAGFYETGANKIFIDSLRRASEADGRAKAVMYGVVAATTAAQTLTTNANFGIGTATFGTSADLVLSLKTGTAPSTSPADAFQLYSADQAAGNACPTFRTEAGQILKLFSAAHIADATTDTTALMNAVNAILVVLENCGLTLSA